MPRGLGDNPLKREKKLRRSSSRASRPGHSAVTADQASALPAGISVPGEAYASSTTSSYNDVFFHRRPEGQTPSVSSVPETIHEETNEVTHVETHVDVPVVARVEEPVDAPIEAALAPVPVAEVIPVETFVAPPPVAIETVQPVAEVPVQSAPDLPAEIATPAAVQDTARSPAPEAAAEEKKGFFGRIFGKWKKS